MNVFDYEVSGFDNERDAGQEMQEKSGSTLLSTGSGNTASNPAVSQAWDDDSEWNVVDEKMDDSEPVKAP